eukprot:COSAG01_NODE_2711_length_7211_cov_31.536839_4_plen_66_part_00
MVVFNAGELEEETTVVHGSVPAADNATSPDFRAGDVKRNQPQTFRTTVLRTRCPSNANTVNRAPE